MEKANRHDRNGKAASTHAREQAEPAAPGRRSITHDIEVAAPTTAELASTLDRTAQLSSSFKSILSLANARLAIVQAAAVRVTADLLRQQIASLPEKLRPEWEKRLSDAQEVLLKLLARSPRISREAIEAGRSGSWAKWDEELAGWERDSANEDKLFAPGQNFRVDPERLAIDVRRSWYEQDTGAAQAYVTQTKMLSALLALQHAGAIPWATRSQLWELASLPPTASTGNVAHFDYGIQAHAIAGLRPGSSAEVVFKDDRLCILLRVDGADGPVNLSTAEIQRIFEAVGTFVGQPVRRDVLAQVDTFHAHLQRKSGAVYLELAGKDLFGEAVWETWKSLSPTSKNELSSVAGELTPGERQRANTWLEASIPSEGLSPSWKLTRPLLYQVDDMIAAAYEPARVRSTYLLRFGNKAAPVVSLDALLIYLRFELEREQALGPRAPGASPDVVRSFFLTPAPATLTSRQDSVTSEKSSLFEVVIDWPVAGILGDRKEALEKTHESTRIDWVFERIDRPATKSTKRTSSLKTEHVFQLGWGEPFGRYRVHAFIEMDQFFPSHRVIDVDVREEHYATKQLSNEALGRAPSAMSPQWKPHEFARTGAEIVFDDKSNFEGIRYQSARGFEARSFDQRMAARNQEIVELGLIEQRYREEGGEHTNALESIGALRTRGQSEKKSLEHDRTSGWSFFDVRATYLSSTRGVPTGSLEIWGETHDSSAGMGSIAELVNPVTVRLRDFSRRNSQEVVSYTASGHTFESALEAAVLDLAKDYPVGRVAIYAEELEKTGKRSTGGMVGFELPTSSRVDRLEKTVFNATTQIALALALTVLGVAFPPAAGVLVLIDTAYNIASIADDISQQERHGTLTGRHIAIQLGTLALSLLPYARSAELLGTTAARRIALYGVELAGQTVVMHEQIRDTLSGLYESDIGALAAIYENIIEIERGVGANDPRLPQLRQQFDDMAAQVRERTFEAFTQAAGQQMVMMLPGHLREAVTSGDATAVTEHQSTVHAAVDETSSSASRAHDLPKVPSDRTPVNELHSSPQHEVDVPQDHEAAPNAHKIETDHPRREADRKARDGEVGHAQIGVHSHFAGEIQPEIYRKRAASVDGGADNGSWLPLLARIESLPSSDRSIRPHSHKNQQLIRTAAGDALWAVKEARATIQVLSQEMQNAAPEAVARYRQDIERVAEAACIAALTATPKTGFDGAYEIRDALVKQTFGDQNPSASPAERKQSAYDDLIRETILALKRQGMRYIEESMGLGKLETTVGPDRIEHIASELAKEGLIEAGEVQVLMLGMVHTAHYGGPDPRLDSQGRSRADDASHDAEIARVRSLIEKSGLIGQDVGGPEYNSFDEVGVRRFERAYISALEHCARTGEILVLRPHVGEGAVDTLPNRTFSRDSDYYAIDGVPSHYSRAEENINQFLNALESLEAKGLYDPTMVNVRMGHVAHATPEQARRMSRLAITAEVNLGSNVVTGSILQTDGVGGAVGANERFDDHSFGSLLYYDTPVILSTDGAAVMHTSPREEFQRAWDLTEQILQGDRPILVRAQEAGLDGRLRGEPTSQDGVRALDVSELTDLELQRFLRGYAKMYENAESYYRRRPRVGSPSASAPVGGAHHVDIARTAGMAFRGTRYHSGTRAQFERAVISYRNAGYVVEMEAGESMAVVSWREKIAGERVATFTTVLEVTDATQPSQAVADSSTAGHQ